MDIESVKKRQIKVSITADNDIPAFAGYLSGSVKDPEIKVVVNIEAMVNTAAEDEISFEELFTTSVVHELLHAIQELYGKGFDEEEVERVLTEAAALHYGEGGK
jgi:hypothetical protein